MSASSCRRDAFAHRSRRSRCVGRASRPTARGVTSDANHRRSSRPPSRRQQFAQEWVSELMANSKLFEECARRILQRELGRRVVLNDDGRENGLVDLCVGDVQSPLIAIECTAALDPVRTETWNLGPGRGKLKFDLNQDWYVVIKPQTRVTELRRRLGGLLRNCETAGIERFAQEDFVLMRQHSSIAEALASLEVDSIHAFREAGSGFVYLTMTGLGGAVDSTGSAVPNWIGDFLRHPKNADVLLKLRRARQRVARFCWRVVWWCTLASRIVPRHTNGPRSHRAPKSA
jgi:hypothetical protein